MATTMTDEWLGDEPEESDDITDKQLSQLIDEWLAERRMDD